MHGNIKPSTEMTMNTSHQKKDRALSSGEDYQVPLDAILLEIFKDQQIIIGIPPKARDSLLMAGNGVNTCKMLIKDTQMLQTIQWYQITFDLFKRTLSLVMEATAPWCP